MRIFTLPDYVWDKLVEDKGSAEDAKAYIRKIHGYNLQIHVETSPSEGYDV